MVAARRNIRTKVGDRSVRNLDALKRTASTSRVLNLLAVAEARSVFDADYADQPFFTNPILNESIILKHRVRQDERYVFDYPPAVATKVILPFERSDLRLGGQSFFVGQRGWTALLEDLTQDQASMDRDRILLLEINDLPSMDPFLLKEHLKRRGYTVAPDYFGISDADLQRMQAYVGLQIQALIELAFPGQTSTASKHKMAGLILSPAVDERLEPLRNVMRLSKENYREGIFSWKGFLYYKWALDDLIPRLVEVVEEIELLKSSGFAHSEHARLIEATKVHLIKNIHLRRLEVQGALQVYDDAYRDLTLKDRPNAFRDFLLNAPSMFLMLGERIGVLSHIVSYWQYRFPKNMDVIANTDEIVEILQEFQFSLEPFEQEFRAAAPTRQIGPRSLEGGVEPKVPRLSSVAGQMQE